MPRRFEERKADLWSTFNRVQENFIKGGLSGRAANGRQQRTRAVQGIDQNLKLNRALWMLAEGMQQLKRSEERRVGKDVSVHVDLGGRRIIQKQTKTTMITKPT